MPRLMQEKERKPVSWKISKADEKLARKIVARVVALGIALRLPERFRELDTTMDLIATHANGCRMDFKRLLAADDANLMHDVGGIRRHLNRTTGKLEDCFLPRFKAVPPRLKPYERAYLASR